MSNEGPQTRESPYLEGGPSIPSNSRRTISSNKVVEVQQITVPNVWLFDYDSKTTAVNKQQIMIINPFSLPLIAGRVIV